MIEIKADMAPIAEYLDYCDGIRDFFEASRTRTRIATRVAEAAKNQFNLFVDAYAPNNEEEIGHMYDWGLLGEAEGRLWDVIIAPAGAGIRVAEYRFLESTKIVPTGPEASGVAEDTRQAKHIFRKKAYVTEEGIPVTISPRDSDWLAIPSGGEMIFTQNTVYHNGNYAGRGSFQNLWLTEMTTLAERIVEIDMRASAERFIHKAERTVETGLSKSNATAKSNFKPKKNMKAKAHKQGELWMDEMDAGTNAQRLMEG